MKKSHLLWKILVVVMIVSAMMATFIACGEDHVAPNDCVDDNGDYKCDVCGAWMTHPHKDENWDDICDICGEQGKPGVHCDWGYHRDQNGDHMCDDCTTIFGAEAGWNGFIAEIDKVIASAGSMGDLATMGGSLTAGIKFEQEEFTDKDNTKTAAVSHDIEINLDFGLDLATEFTPATAHLGSGNAFGVTITDTVGETTTTLLGLWYVDNGSAAKNYILAKFGEEEFKINAPSLAETFANYPINVDVNIADKVNGVNVSGNSMVGTIVGVLSGILPLQVAEGTNSTTYSIPLTDFLFNKVGMTEEAYGLGALLNQGLASLAGITDLINAIGLDSSALLDTLDALLPGLAIDVTFNRDAAGNTNGVALGLSIAGEPMSVELYHPTADTTDGLIYDIFKTEADAGNGTIIINNGFGDIEMDVTLGYEFGSNAMGSADDGEGYKYSDPIKADYAAAEKALTNAREIGLLNVAFEGEVLLGMGGEAKTYNIKVAADLDPSVMTDKALLKEVVKVNDQGQGLWTDKNDNKQYDAGEEDTTVAINFGAGKNTIDVVLSMIDKLYLNISNDEGGLTVIKAGETKYDEKTGKVSNFPIVIQGVSWLGNLLDTFLDDEAMETVGGIIGEGALISGDMGTLERPANLAGLPIDDVLSTMIKVNGVADLDAVTAWAPYVEPSKGDDNTGEGSGESSGEGSGTSFALTDIIKYIDMFKFDRTDKDTLKLTVDEDDMNGAGVKFEATASVTRDADGTVDSLTLSLGADGLVINGSDKVNTTIKTVDGWPLLKIGGEGNLFKAAVSVSQTGTDSPLNLTLGINLKKVGYGLVNSYITTNEEFEAMFSKENEKLFISSTPIASATE